MSYQEYSGSVPPIDLYIDLDINGRDNYVGIRGGFVPRWVWRAHGATDESGGLIQIAAGPFWAEIHWGFGEEDGEAR